MDISHVKTFIINHKETTSVITISCLMAGYTSTVIYSVIFLLSVVAYVSLTNRNNNSNNNDQEDNKQKNKKNNDESLTVKKSNQSVIVEKKIQSSPSSSSSNITKVLPSTPPKQQPSSSSPSTPPPPIPPRPSASPNVTPTKNIVGGQLSNSYGTPASPPAHPPLTRKNNTQPDLSYSPSSPSGASPSSGSQSAPSSPAGASTTPTLKKTSTSASSTPTKDEDKKGKVGMSTLRGIIGGVVGKKSSSPSTPSISPEEKEKNDLKRKQITEEILMTERAYVGKLKVISEVFYIPLKTAATANPHPPLTLDQVHTVFSEILTIYNYNSHFLNSLEEKLKSSSSSNILIGDTFIEITAYLKTYTVYINNYSKAIATLEKARKNQNFDTLLQKFTQENSACDGLDLTSLLIMPVQRIPRYILLLQELLKVTDKKEKEYTSLNTAFLKMKELASDMNENRRQAELLNSMYDLQNRLDGFKGDFIVPARKLLMEGDFHEKVFSTTSNSAVATSTRRYILCSDILLRTKVKGKKLIVKEVLNISNIQFKDLSGEALSIHSDASGVIYALKAIAPDDSSVSNIEDKWKDAIQAQQKVLQDNEHQRRQSIGKTN